jgi:hypothetical protein
MENTQSVSNQKATPFEGLTLEQQRQKVEEQMAKILFAMREPQEAEPPKETDDASVITHVEFLPEGGMLTYLQRYEKPFRGFPFNGTVQQIDEVKKLAKIITQKFFSEFKKSSLLSKIKIFFSLDLLKTLVIGYLQAYHWQIKKQRLRPHMYSKCVRELWTEINNSRDILYDDNLREAVRDSLCMFLEFDNAYRFRFQDILPEMDKNALKSNPLREIKRLIDLLIEREVAEPGKVKMADKWKMFRRLIITFLRFNKPILKDIQRLLLRINLLEIEMTPEDRYYCEFRRDYKFGFMTRGAIPRREIPKGLPLKAPSTVEEINKPK